MKTHIDFKVRWLELVNEIDNKSITPFILDKLKNPILQTNMDYTDLLNCPDSYEIINGMIKVQIERIKGLYNED